MKNFFLVVTLAGLVAAAGAFALVDWSDVEVSGQGFFAMASGVGFTILLGSGLMALTFYSNREGHDVGFETSTAEDETKHEIMCAETVTGS